MIGPVLDLEGVTKSYGDFKAVDGLSFAMGPGEVLGFLGPNGAGKTSTMRMILGLILAEERGEPLVEVDELLGRGAHIVRCHGGSLPTKGLTDEASADSRVL